jgi:Toprim domain
MGTVTKWVDYDWRAAPTRPLGGTWHSGNPSYGLVKCVAHDDRTPSLSIRDGDHGVVARCFAGCDAHDVFAELGARRKLSFADLTRLTGERLGRFDVACPLCGPYRRALVNQRRPVLRVWRLEPGFATFLCVRCGEKGWARDRSAALPDPVKLARARAEAVECDRVGAAERLSKARWLWSKRQPIAGSIAETYLRQARVYQGPLPATLGFLPARGKHGPAMIAAFGLPTEPEPGRLAIADDAICGVHITRLAPEGLGKAGTETDKIMVGLSHGSSIVLAPPNNLLGLLIAEGIEDALSGHEATGLGAWAAGSASRLPALAASVPHWIEAVTILAHDDRDGRRYAATLSGNLRQRNATEVDVIVLGAQTRTTTI